VYCHRPQVWTAPGRVPWGFC